jgi:hypothetical protein
MPEEAQMATFDRLAALFAPYRSVLVTKSDAPGDLYLEAPPSASYPNGLFFGAVKIGKRYVSFHLMPVYVHPELLEDISPELRKRMQGKSCFNFTKPDATLFAELAGLTAAGFEAYERDGTISPLAARR